MWGFAVNRLLHFSNAAFITGINLLLHTTILIGICLACRSVVKRKGGKAATQSVLLRACLVAAILSPLTLSLFTLTGMNTFYLSTTLLNPHEYTGVISQKSIRPQSSTRLSEIHKEKKTKPLENAGLKYPAAATSRKADSPTKDNESKKVALPTGVQGKKHTNLTSPGDVGKNMENHTGRRKTTISREKIISGLAVLFTGLWCVFSMFLFVRFIAINLYIRRIRQLATEAKPAYGKTCRKAAEELGIKSPAILQSRYVHSTMITGFFKPSIILPTGANEVPMASREVFLHELAHLARRDYLWNQLGQVCKIILPIQPLIWVLARLIEEISDYVCDDYVVKFSTFNRPYAAQLFNLAQSSQPEYPEIQAGAGIVSAGSPLRKRIERILDNSYARHVKINANEAMSITLLFVCSITFTGFIGVDRPGILPHSKYVTQQSKDEIKTRAGKQSDVMQYPDNTNSSSLFDIPQADSELKSEITHGIDNEIGEVKQKFTVEDVNNTESFPVERPFPDTFGQENADPKFSDVSDEGGEITSEAGIVSEKSSSEQENGGEIIVDNSNFISDRSAITETELKNETDNSSLSAVNPMVQASAFSNGEFAELFPEAVEVIIPQKFENADRSDPVGKKMSDLYRSVKKNKQYPVWSPDGKWIAFTDVDYGIWMVPAQGGEPKVVYESYYNIDYKNNKLNFGDLETLCFTPDGNEITFRRFYCDEKKGTVVELDYNDGIPRYDIENPIPVIESVNILTGERRVIVDNAFSGNWSYDGRYFAYIYKVSVFYNGVAVLDTATDEWWDTGIKRATEVLFSPDDEYLIVNIREKDTSQKLIKIPFHGGEPVLLAYDKEGDISDCSPDGEWILISEPTENGMKQVLYNTGTNTSMELFPEADFNAYWGKFSPDGTKILFNLRAKNRDKAEFEMYIHHINFESQKIHELSDSDNRTPVNFTLNKNFPNPFNLSTTLEFSLPEHGHTTLVIYNSNGQKIRELISDTLNPGIHHVQWDGRNDFGNRVSSGIYLSRLTFGTGVLTGKMSLVK